MSNKCRSYLHKSQGSQLSTLLQRHLNKSQFYKLVPVHLTYQYSAAVAALHRHQQGTSAVFTTRVAPRHQGDAARALQVQREATHALKVDPRSTSMHVAELARVPSAAPSGIQHLGFNAGTSTTSNHASSVRNTGTRVRTVRRPIGVIYAPGVDIVL